MSVLPEGTKLIATGVITPFMVPLKLTLFVAFLIALPYVLYQAGRSSRPGCICTRSGWRADHRLQHPCSRSAWRTATSSSSARVPLHRRLRADRSTSPRTSSLLQLRARPVPRFRPDLRGADHRRAAGALRHRRRRAAEGGAPLRDRRRVHRRGHLHAARRALAAAAGDPAVPAVRGWHPAGPPRRQAPIPRRPTRYRWQVAQKGCHDDARRLLRALRMARSPAVWWRHCSRSPPRRRRSCTSFRMTIPILPAAGLPTRPRSAGRAGPFRRAAERNQRVAQFNLAVMLIAATASAADPRQGLAWLRRAADNGMARAQFSLARCSSRGEHVPNSLGRGDGWYEKAAGRAGAMRSSPGDPVLPGARRAARLRRAARWYEKRGRAGR
jgi:hypothetical protein